jgi:hypothetical protein
MQKISIKNFGPIHSIENLEVSRVLLLIGQQASGKSTISKLIYFFKSLREDVLSCLMDHILSENLTEAQIKATQDYLFPKIRTRFYSFFGSTKDESFSLQYDFNDTLNVNLAPNKIGSLEIQFSEAWFQQEFHALIVRWNEFLGLSHQNRIHQKESSADSLLRKKEEKRLEILKLEIDDQIDGLFGLDNSRDRGMYFIPAGRSLLSSLKQSFQSKFIEELAHSKSMEEISLESSFKANKEIQERKSYFDFFVGDFFGKIDHIKRILFGKSLWDALAEVEFLEGKSIEPARRFLEGMYKVLKAEYQVDQNGERLFAPKFKKPIPLDFASSGQQEVVWILLQLFSLLLENQPAFVIIEEPEAHLYPTAQVDVLNLISLFLSANPGNQVIITTHSPYMLTAANNLLFAHRVNARVGNDATKIAAITEVVGTDAWFDPEKFGAYYLSEDKIVSIFSKETGVISESELDNASDAIMDTFDALMEIYKPS